MTAARPLRAGLALVLVLFTLASVTQAATTRQQRPRKAPPKVEATLPPASDDQIAAAAMAHVGAYECEFNETISVGMNPKFDAYLDIRHRKNSWIMRPVLSRTGALRLEDVKGRMLMLQIANKSMLMDTRVGQRVVDNCVHERQREQMANQKGESESIGIDPVKAAAAAAAASAASAPN